MKAFVIFYCEACGVEIHKERWTGQAFIADTEYCDACQESYDKMFEEWKKSRANER